MITYHIEGTALRVNAQAFISAIIAAEVESRITFETASAASPFIAISGNVIADKAMKPFVMSICSAYGIACTVEVSST